MFKLDVKFELVLGNEALWDSLSKSDMGWLIELLDFAFVQLTW
jgi:hypothetical protein